MQIEYKPITLKDSENFFVGCFVDGKFSSLHSIHNTPTAAIDAAHEAQNIAGKAEYGNFEDKD